MYVEAIGLHTIGAQFDSIRCWFSFHLDQHEWWVGNGLNIACKDRGCSQETGTTGKWGNNWARVTMIIFSNSCSLAGALRCRPNIVGDSSSPFINCILLFSLYLRLSHWGSNRKQLIDQVSACEWGKRQNKMCLCIDESSEICGTISSSNRLAITLPHCAQCAIRMVCVMQEEKGMGPAVDSKAS